ncbi:cation transporter [Pseudomonas sp. R-28-1W-6]|uniref:DUF6482 family protein n=1 Tax=Pseudomonas sp. R-28-1W-6 TaxID=2650101 RepID=UPI0013664C3D|nr:DUF6482 family protein [Pseudomonas sp. R-28-1W-6]MWV11785.1 cation transporter [Pseudomonas sp. R-28-1W-6]
MKLHDLLVHAHAGHVDELNLVSLEGGIYVLEVHMDGKALPVKDEHGKILHLRSVEHARDVLQQLPRLPFHLVHAEVHDEMCGMQPAACQPLRVPISMNSAW